jgi:VIT1/CCC1 family predicted Fe2+/Mn2+ transporter
MFTAGAIFPVVPFFFVAGTKGMLSSLALSVVALAIVGLATSLFSGRGPVYSVIRQVIIGAAAAGVTYATGALIGVSVS